MSQNKYVKFSELDLSNSHVTIPTSEIERIADLLNGRDEIIESLKSDDKVIREITVNSTYTGLPHGKYYVNERTLRPLELERFTDGVQRIIDESDKLEIHNRKLDNRNRDLHRTIRKHEKQREDFNNLSWYKKLTFKFNIDNE